MAGNIDKQLIPILGGLSNKLWTSLWKCRIFEKHVIQTVQWRDEMKGGFFSTTILFGTAVVLLCKEISFWVALFQEPFQKFHSQIYSYRILARIPLSSSPKLIACLDWLWINYLRYLNAEKSQGFKSGDLGGQAIGLPLPIHQSQFFSSSIKLSSSYSSIKSVCLPILNDLERPYLLFGNFSACPYGASVAFQFISQ